MWALTLHCARRQCKPSHFAKAYIILCSVLLGTADNLIWHILSFQVDTHWWEVKGIKSYLQCVKIAKWQKHLRPSCKGHPHEALKPVISQQLLYCLWVCVFMCFLLVSFGVCVIKCIYVLVCWCVCACVKLLKIWQKQHSPSCQHYPPEALKSFISQLPVVPTRASTTG